MTPARASVADGTVARLVRSSREFEQSPYTGVDWPAALDPECAWFFTPELSSLYGTQDWDRLAEAERRRLSFHEALNFFSLNIHGERILMQGLAARLYRPEFLDVADYLHHFLDEENKHSVYFGQFCRRYGRIYPSRQVPMAEPGDADGDVVFFARVLVFEEIVDRYNVAQSRDERLHPLVRLINQRHHADEARHLIFGRHLVRALCDRRREQWSEAGLAALRRTMRQFLEATWREYYNPEVYADSGLPSPWDVAATAWESPAQRQQRARTSSRCLQLLHSCGLADAPDHGG